MQISNLKEVAMRRLRPPIKILAETSEQMANVTGVMAGAPRGELMLAHKLLITEGKELKASSTREDPIKMKLRLKQRLVMARILQTTMQPLAIKEPLPKTWTW